MPRKKSIAIPEVDIIKAGLNKPRKDDLREKGLVDGTNSVILTCNDDIKDLAKKSDIEKLRQKEKEFRELEKQIKEDYNMDKESIKSESKKIEKKKKKKKDKNGKKKSNKKKKKSSYKEDLLNSVPLDLSEYIRSGGDKGLKKKKKKEKKKKKKKEREREELGIKVKEKKKIQKNSEEKKKEESEVAKRFKEVEKITRENIKEIDTTLQVVDKRIKELTSSSERIRGKDTALANYFAAKTSLISTKQKAATDILSSRAKVYDIEMKKEKSAQSDADILSRIFPGIALNDSKTNDIKDYISKNGKNKDKKKRKKSKSYDAEVLMNREKELRKSGDIEYSDWNKNIEWEGNYNVAIKKSWKTGDWKFIAVDDDGNIMRDVPKAMLPSKNSVQIAFDDEKDKAIDKNTNTMYNVLAVPSI